MIKIEKVGMEYEGELGGLVLEGWICYGAKDDI
jgi:hypothetical protein